MLTPLAMVLIAQQRARHDEERRDFAVRRRC